MPIAVIYRSASKEGAKWAAIGHETPCFERRREGRGRREPRVFSENFAMRRRFERAPAEQYK